MKLKGGKPNVDTSINQAKKQLTSFGLASFNVSINLSTSTVFSNARSVPLLTAQTEFLLFSIPKQAFYYEMLTRPTGT